MREAERVARLAILLASFAAALPLGGCATPSWLCWFPSGVKNVTLVTTPATNGDQAIAVDLVFVTQALAAQQIGTLSARDYFIRRAQILRDFPQTVEVRSWELAPGQLVQNAAAKPPCNLVQTFVFADFASKGDHRATIAGGGSVEIALGPDELSIEP
jgi:type VI secretion system protein